MIYLDLSWLKCTIEDIEVILASCHSLEKLSLADATITSKMIHSISMPNGTTLQLLNLDLCKGLGSAEPALSEFVFFTHAYF